MQLLPNEIIQVLVHELTRFVIFTLYRVNFVQQRGRTVGNCPGACPQLLPRENRSQIDPGSPEIEVETGQMRTYSVHELTRSGMVM